MIDFSMSFDQRSLSEIAQFYGFGVFLTAEMAVAMQEAGALLTAAAQAKTWQVFANPTGRLAGSISPVMVGPMEVEIGVGVPYGRRREYGFSGMTDSLGRYYPSDPAKPYMQPTLDENQQAVLQLIEDAALRAMARIGGG